jgi:hypothetical protein
VPGAPLRIAAIGVNHWHSLYDSAYLRHLAGMPDVQLVALQDASAEIADKRAASLGPPDLHRLPSDAGRDSPGFRHRAGAAPRHGRARSLPAGRGISFLRRGHVGFTIGADRLDSPSATPWITSDAARSRPSACTIVVGSCTSSTKRTNSPAGLTANSRGAASCLSRLPREDPARGRKHAQGHGNRPIPQRAQSLRRRIR